MAYCPQCLTEYREGVAECMDCRVALRPGLPPRVARDAHESEPALVRLRVFSGPMAPLDADLARNILATQGIQCVLPGERSAMLPGGAGIVQLLVRERDAEEAAEILKSYLDTPASAGPEPLPEE